MFMEHSSKSNVTVTSPNPSSTQHPAGNQSQMSDQEFQDFAKTMGQWFVASLNQGSLMSQDPPTKAKN
jgi:hypothetical protein